MTHAKPRLSRQPNVMKGVQGIQKSKSRTTTPQAVTDGLKAAQTINGASRKVGILELDACECRWPVSDSSTDHLFCGAPTQAGQPYCADHMAVAYLPTAQREREKKDVEGFLDALAGRTKAAWEGA